MDLVQYRDPWLGEKFDEFVGFYPREFYCLDNFSSFGIIFEGNRYPTVEHAYQSLRFAGVAPEIEQSIRNALSAHEAQKLAYANRDKQRPDFDSIKIALMEKLLSAKLEQNPYVRKKLLQIPRSCEICEDSPYDSFWGIGKDRTGRNELGHLWMKLRKELLDSNESTLG